MLPNIIYQLFYSQINKLPNNAPVRYNYSVSILGIDIQSALDFSKPKSFYDISESLYLITYHLFTKSRKVW